MFHPERCSPNGGFKNDAFSRCSCSTLFTVKAWYTMSISHAATGAMLRSKKRRTIEIDRRCGSFDSHCSQCFLASFLYLRCKLRPLHGMSSARYENPSMHLACVPDIISIGWCTSLPSRLNPTASAFETWDSVTVVRNLVKSSCTWSLLFLWTTKCLFIETFSQDFQPQRSRRIGLSSTKKRGLLFLYTSSVVWENGWESLPLIVTLLYWNVAAINPDTCVVIFQGLLILRF